MTTLEQLEKEFLEDEDNKRYHDLMKPYREFINKLIDYRLKNNLSQKELSKILGLKKNKIKKIEQEILEPTFSEVLLICDKIGLVVKI